MTILQVTYARVYNLGNYESLRLEAVALVVDDATGAAWEEARAAVEAEYAISQQARVQAAPQPNAGATYDPPATDNQRRYIATLQDKLAWDSEQLAVYASEQGVDLVAMTKAQASGFIDGLKRLAEQTTKEEGIIRWSERVIGKKSAPADDSADIPF